MHNLANNIVNETAGHILPVNVDTSRQLPGSSNGYRPLPPWVAVFCINIRCTSEPGIEDMGACCPPDHKPARPECKEHVFHAACCFCGNISDRISLSQDLYVGNNLHSVLDTEVHISCSKGSAGVGPADDGFDSRYTVSCSPTIEHTFTAYDFSKDSATFVSPVICGMTGFGKNEVGPGRFITPTTEDNVTAFIDMGFAQRMNGGREWAERCGIT